MRLNTLSIRAKVLTLVTGVALLVGVVSAIYSYVSSGRLLRQQMVKRGDYIADNLAYNAKYGVLTEDKTLLTQLLQGAMSAGASEGSDVVGAMIRDAKGNVLAQVGTGPRELPPVSDEPGTREDLTADGEPEVGLILLPELAARFTAMLDFARFA